MTAEHSHRFPPRHAEPVPDAASASAAGADGATVVTVRRWIERESSDAGPDDALTVVAVEGEIDEDTAALVELALARALDGRTSVCCDLHLVTFFGAAGARTLLVAHARAARSGRVFFLRGVRGTTARVLDVVDPGQIVPR